MQNTNILGKWSSFATFPCKLNSKIPATRNGFKDAQFGQDVAAMVNQGYNVAIACEKSGVIVIDVDYHNEKSTAMEDLKDLELKLGVELPYTLTQATASGNGRHLIYSAKGINNPRGKIGQFCDIKYRGYVMIAPSSIAGRQYQIIDGVDDNGNFIISELPQAWVDYINKDVPTLPTSTQTSEVKEVVPKIYKHIDVEKMFSGCNFLAYCRDNADTLSEPEWFSMVSVLAQIENSDDLIHTLSEPYPKYTFDETQKKIDNARKFGHSQSCAYISENYSEICKDCNYAKNAKDVKLCQI